MARHSAGALKAEAKTSLGAFESSCTAPGAASGLTPDATPSRRGADYTSIGARSHAFATTQKLSFSANWIWRIVPAEVIVPKVELGAGLEPLFQLNWPPTFNCT